MTRTEILEAATQRRITWDLNRWVCDGEDVTVIVKELRSEGVLVNEYDGRGRPTFVIVK